jgi:O-antigen ligase
MADATTTSLPLRRALLAAALSATILPLSLWIGQAPIQAPLAAVTAAILFLASVLHAEAGLIILILSMLLSPEFALGTGGGTSLEGSRSLILRTEDLVLILVGFAWFARMAIHKDLGAIRRTRLNAFLFAYSASCLFSTLIGIETGRVRALLGLCFVAKYVEYFFIFFMTVNYVDNRERLRRLLVVVLITAALIIVYACWQIPQGVRPSAPFEGGEGEPNTLGGYLVLVFSVASGIALTVPDRRWKRSCWILAAASIPPLLATLSRSSWLALAASLLVLLALSPDRRRLAAVTILAASLLFFVHPRNVEERVLYTFHGEEQGTLAVGRVHLDSSASARISSWGSALAGFVAHPVAGWGVTGYGFLDAQYFRILVELGLVGLTVFGLLIGTAGSLFYRLFTSPGDPLHRGLGLGMAAALAGLLAHAIGTNTFMLIRIMEPFWLLTGLCVAALALRETT